MRRGRREGREDWEIDRWERRKVKNRGGREGKEDRWKNGKRIGKERREERMGRDWKKRKSIV